MTDPPQKAQRSFDLRAGHLNKGQRLLFGLAGLAMLFPAEWAVVQGRDVGAAGLGLVVIGGLSLLVAVLGRLPLEVKWGDKSVNMGVLDTIVDEVSPEGLARVAGQITESQDPASSDALANHLVQHAVFEQRILAAFRRGAEAVGGQVVDSSMMNGFRWDACASRKSITLYVAIRTNLDDHFAHNLRVRATKISADSNILLVARRVTDSSRALLLKTGRPVTILSLQDESALASRVEDTVQEILRAE